MPANADPPDAARRPLPARHRAAEPADRPVTGPENDLRRMVGLPADGSFEELRASYDLAMHRATRSGDHQHALALSRAYDRLPIATRHRLYPSSRTAAGATTPPRTPGRTRYAAGPTRSRRRPGRSGRRRGLVTRVLVYGMFASVGLGGCVYLATHAREASPRSSPVVHATSSGGAPTAGLPTAPRLVGSGRPVVVPTDAPTGANGLVTLACRAGSDAGDYLMTAPRGAVVACSNGALPAVIG